MAHVPMLITSLLNVDMEKALAVAHGSYMRVCAKCDINKPPSLFPKHKLGKGGYNPYCRTCESERSREYRMKKKEMRISHHEKE